MKSKYHGKKLVHQLCVITFCLSDILWPAIKYYCRMETEKHLEKFAPCLHTVALMA